MRSQMESMQADIQEKVALGMAAKVEAALDAQIKAADDDMDSIEVLRKKRIQQMAKDAKLKRELVAIGHTKYTEISDEKEFFECAKKSPLMVCHFYREATWRCEIVDKHLKLLAPKCWKTRFIKIDAEKCAFLVERLKIFMLPTITCVVNGQVVDHVVGFDDMGGSDDFPTEALGLRLKATGCIEYEGGDVSAGPVHTGKTKGYIGHRRQKGD